MSFPCKCPPIGKQPVQYQAYTCQPDSIYINYIMSLLLLRSNFYNYLQTGVDQAPDLKNKYSYLVPIYTFKYYSIVDPKVVLKTYTYEQLFNIFLVAQQYKTYATVPFEIRESWDKVDKECYENIVLLPSTGQLYDAIALANSYRAQGLKYSYTYKIPYDLSLKAPKGQLTSKCYTGDELITISRNAQLFVNAYLFDGEFPFFNP